MCRQTDLSEVIIAKKKKKKILTRLNRRWDFNRFRKCPTGRSLCKYGP